MSIQDNIIWQRKTDQRVQVLSIRLSITLNVSDTRMYAGQQVNRNN